MKRIICILLAAALFVSTAMAALAESAVTYTPKDVVQWLEENDGKTENAAEQAVNAAQRLAEMLVYVDGMNANEDQLETLQSILDAVKEIGEDADASPYQNLAVSCVQVVRALVVLANESDPNGVYGETLDGIIEDYNRVNDAVETADAQSANALFTAMKVTSLVVKECCASQEQIDQIDEGLAQFDAENEAAADVNEQTVVCARWLRRMLGAFAKLNNAGCAGDIDAQMERTEDVITSGDLNLEQKTVQYLASSVYALAIFTGDMTME